MLSFGGLLDAGTFLYTLLQEGLVENRNHPELPPCGILGYIQQKNPNVVFLSSGGTYQLLKRNRFNVIDFEEYTSAPQMKDGLVKSIDYRIHSSILAQDFNPEDLEFLQKNGLLKIDAVFTNFNRLDTNGVSKIDTMERLEEYRNRIDLGGPLRTGIEVCYYSIIIRPLLEH